MSFFVIILFVFFLHFYFFINKILQILVRYIELITFIPNNLTLIYEYEKKLLFKKETKPLGKSMAKIADDLLNGFVWATIVCANSSGW